MQHGLGYKPSHLDPRDIPFGVLMRAAPVPDRSDGTKAYAGPLVSQEDADGCVGWSLAGCLNTRWNYLAGMQGVSPPGRPSAMMAWWLARQTEGFEKNNQGVYIRDAVKQVIRVGICAEKYCVSNPPTELVGDVPRFALSPTVEAFQHANAQRVGDKFPMGYYSLGLMLSERRAQISQSLSSGFPVQIGTQVTTAFLALGPHAPLPPPGPTDEIAGGHALECTHYDELGVYGPNTWQDPARGIFWGNDGWFALSWPYVLWQYTQDLWAYDAALPGAWS